MKERPVLFSAPMVRALLAGTKTQTRRVVKPQPIADDRFSGGHYIASKKTEGAQFSVEAPYIGLACPYGQPGDRLWVRENFAPTMLDGVYQYAATGGLVGTKWKPSIHMPRAACRILLEITAVRVERLKDISEADARAEGITFTDYGRKCGHTGAGWVDVGDCPAPATAHPQRPGWGVEPANHEQCMHSAPAAYASLWEQINGAGSWNANPWVWVVEFRVVGRAAASMGGREG